MISKFRNEHFFLSNFYPSEIVEDGIEYESIENYFQAMKSDSPMVRKSIGILNPSDAKKAGRRLKINPAEWNAKKDDIMFHALKIKFSNPKLMEMLRATAGEELVEGNTWNDCYWGVCNGKGLNKLGKMLMEIRGQS